MELNAISGGRKQHGQLKKNEHNTGLVPSYQGDLDSDKEVGNSDVSLSFNTAWRQGGSLLCSTW